MKALIPIVALAAVLSGCVSGGDRVGVFRADMSEPGKVATWCSGAPMLLPAHFHQSAMLMHYP